LRYDHSFNASSGSNSHIEIKVRRWHAVLETTYFEVHQPELAEGADDGQEARFEQGQDVGLLAQRRFPGGVFVGFEHGVADALANTLDLMDNSSVPAIFEATFQHSNLLVRVDILQRRPRNRWHRQTGPRRRRSR
jgi:hypothetical protein